MSVNFVPDPPPVARHLEGRDHTVTVDLATLLPDLLANVARVIRRNHLHMELEVLMYGGSSIRRDLAAQTLLADSSVRRALSVEFAASDAVRLGEALRDAGDELPQCSKAGCDNPTVRADNVCDDCDEAAWDQHRAVGE